MTYFTAAVVVVSAIAAAILTTWLCGRWVSLNTRRRHHEVGSPVFSQVGTLIAVLLAFVFSAVWSDYRTAAEAINGECGALHGAAMMAEALPDGEGAPVIRAIAGYSKDVVEVEWPALAARRRSPLAAVALQAAIDRAARIAVNRPSDAATKAEVLSLLAAAHANRETRVFQVTQSVPTVMWLMLIAISIVLTLFIAFAGIEEPGRILFAGTFAGAMTLVLVLVRMLDFPFEGALALPPTDFLKLLNETVALGAP